MANLKGQYVGIKAIQSHVILKPEKSLLNKVLQSVWIYNKHTMTDELHKVKLEYPSK